MILKHMNVKVRRFYRKIKAGFITKKADKFRDFYRDEQSRMILRVREKWIESRDIGIFVSNRMCSYRERGGENRILRFQIWMEYKI